jgi:hypothetical protein
MDHRADQLSSMTRSPERFSPMTRRLPSCREAGPDDED